MNGQRHRLQVREIVERLGRKGDRKYERTERIERMSGQIGRKREQPKIQK